jgi:HTH-type transcriptional regulator/antitoxin MqsA
VLDREHGDRDSELIGAFRREVNAADVDPAFIVGEIRSA